MKRYVHFPKVEGQASRQAHADLPAGTYEREISKEGFFGPAAHLYHRHPPTGWVEFRRPAAPARLRLHEARRQRRTRPGTRPSCCTTPRCACASGAATANMPAARAQRRRRRAAVRARRARRVLLRLRPPVVRGRRLHPDSARHDVARRVRGAAARAAHRGHQQLLPPARQGAGGPARHLRPRDARHAAHRRRVQGPAGRDASGASRSSAAARSPPSPIRSIRWTRWAGTAISSRGAHQRARPAAAHEPSLSPAALGAHHLPRRPLRGVHLRAAAVRDPIRAR